MILHWIILWRQKYRLLSARFLTSASARGEIGTKLRRYTDSDGARMGEADDMLASRPLYFAQPEVRSGHGAFGDAQASLGDRLILEDAAEERAALSPHERTTCPVHRRWSYQCVSSPSHAIRVTGHRWCRSCDAAVTVSVDELTGSITLTCPHCHRFPNTAANRQVIRSCRASFLARQGREPLTLIPAPRQAA